MTTETPATPATPATPPVTPPAQPSTPATPSVPDPKTPATPATSDFKLREEYKDKPWAAKIKSEEDLYKQIDNLDTLVGKKSVVPDFKTSTPEDIEKYFSTLRPKDKAEYQFDDKTTTPELKSAFTEMFYKNGVSAYQANNIIKEYNALEAATKAKMYDKDAFFVEAEKVHGKDYKATIDKARGVVKQALPPELFAKVDKLSNEAYVSLTEITSTLYNKFDAKVKEIQKQYGATESGIGGSDTPSLAGGTDQLQSEITKTRQEIKDMAKRNHTAAEHKEKTDKLTSLIMKKHGAA